MKSRTQKCKQAFPLCKWQESVHHKVWSERQRFSCPVFVREQVVSGTFYMLFTTHSLFHRCICVYHLNTLPDKTNKQHVAQYGQSFSLCCCVPANHQDNLFYESFPRILYSSDSSKAHERIRPAKQNGVRRQAVALTVCTCPLVRDLLDFFQLTFPSRIALVSVIKTH